MRQPFRAGQPAYFHHLHDDRKATLINDDQDEWGDYTFKIEGKARRMIVLGQRPRIRVESARNTGELSGANECTYYEAKGKLGYLVVSVQTKMPRTGYSVNEASSMGKQPFLPFQDLLESGKRSFIELRPYVYPAESADNDRYFKPIPTEVLNQILKEMAWAGLNSEDH